MAYQGRAGNPELPGGFSLIKRASGKGFEDM
jgi:hypothetical protein